MDEEMENLALLALHNSFYTDFSALVNKYMEAAEGLDFDLLKMQMQESCNVYSRDYTADGDMSINIWAQQGEDPSDTLGYDALCDALSEETATKVYLQGDLVFERIEGDWYFVEHTERKG